MERKKILITIDWFLPGTKSGGPVRSYANMIAHLGAYHDFYIITRNTDYCSDVVYTEVQSNAWNQLEKNMFVYYFSKDKLTKANFKKLLNETPFDIAYINGIYSWYFSILPLLLLKKHSQVIVAARGMLNPQAFAVKGLKKKIFLVATKVYGLYKNVTFHATNQDESDYIQSRVGAHVKTKIAPNLPRILDISTNSVKRKNNVTSFVNIARISKEKGTLKMIESLNKVQNELVLDLYGPIYDELYWQKCKESIQNLPVNVHVSYKGVLPSEDVPQVLSAYDFFVLLSEGENFGHAILEALMAGCPVLISDQTPWKNLTSKGIGWDIPLHQTSDIVSAFEKAIQMPEEEFEHSSQKAYQFAQQFSTNPELLALNLELFK